VPPRVRLRRLVLLPLLMLAVLASVTALGPTAQAASGSRSGKVSRAATVALHQVGDPYRYGATGPNSFDCSGLMQYSFGKAGLRIPRTSAAQAKSAHRIARNRLKRGDLMFFARGGRVYHAAMFLRWTKGHAVMLHAPGSGKRVRVDRPWTNRWFAGTFR
jgi:cell wall-associated NlpC family hydrolase